MKNIIVAPFHLPWEWSADYANQTCYTLSKYTIVVCYLWADTATLKDYLVKRKLPTLFRKHSKNLYLFTPIYFLPFRRFEIVEKFNKNINLTLLHLVITLLKFKNKLGKTILWCFYAIPEVIDSFKGPETVFVYDCADYFSGSARNNKEKETILHEEKKLTQTANLTVANSLVLQKHLKKWRTDIPLVPQGFRIQDFQNPKNYKSPKLKLGSPIIGFAGAVNHRINYDILIPLVKKHPEWNFVIWGPVLDRERVTPKIWQKMSTLLAFSNVSTGFLKDRTKLPGVFKQFDITMIPYDISQDFNKYCYPMKLFEFFYLGLPVMSTEVLELRRFPELVKVGKNYKEWEKIIKCLLKKPWPQDLKKKALILAQKNSWENKIKEVLVYLEKRVGITP